jgi:hypothetical protein
MLTFRDIKRVREKKEKEKIQRNPFTWEVVHKHKSLDSKTYELW